MFRDGRRGGGISVYISNNIRAQSLDKCCYINDFIEINTVRMCLGCATNVTIVAIYRPSNEVNIPDFNVHLGHVLASFPRSTPVYEVGDINIDILKQDRVRSDFIETMRSLSYIPLITIPTRVTDNSATLLDQIWTNQLHESGSAVLRILTTDHFPVLTSTVFHNSSKNTTVTKVFRDHSDQALSNLRNDCAAFLRYFDQFSQLNIESRVNIFHERFYQLYNRHCTLITKQISLKSFMRPWITNDIKRLINRKHFYFRRYKQGLVPFDVYNHLKNLCSRMITKSKVDYFKHKFDSCKGDLKNTWKNLKYLMNTKVTSRTITMLRNKGRDLLHPGEIAGAFNEYFTDVGAMLDAAIPRVQNISPTDYLQNPIVNSFYANPSTSAEVAKVISSFKTKGGCFKWTPIYIYKSLSDIISGHISDLFNSSIAEGCFPSSLKQARVIPIFKSGCRRDVSNYRPISTLPVLSKIFERLMCSRLKQFLSQNNILVNHQFGFKSGSNTGDAVLEFLDRVYNLLDEGQMLMPVYLDFSKAFDTVNHQILLQKLNHYGIRGIINNWFESYLSSRTQYVSINEENSNIMSVSMGVPQGSVIGPVLFLVYINDMSCSSSLDFIHFADDTTIVASEATEGSLFAKVNMELSCIDKWLSVNRLSLNIKKTKYMIITHKTFLNNYKIRIRRKKIKRTNCIKFLGIQMDDKLNFDSHAIYICGKVARAVGVINRISYHLSFQQLVNLYYSIIYPHLIYCITVWGRSGSTGMGRVQRIQRRALRVITRYEVNHQLITNHLMNIDSVYSYFASIKLFKLLKEDQHTYFYNRVINVQVNHGHATRFKSNYCLVAPFFRKSTCQHSFVYQSIIIWNRLPTNIRNCDSINIFKKLLKKYLLSQQERILDEV